MGLPVFYVAHRLKTVLAYYDLIMIMEGGEVVEFNSPVNVFKKIEFSIYYLKRVTNLDNWSI